jgi:hypothetical protein
MQISLALEHTAMRIESRFKMLQGNLMEVLSILTHSRTIIDNGCGVVKRTA